MKKGKIKFSTLSNNRGVKIDNFRIVEDAKDKKGDWQLKAEFPEAVSELEFYFPFTKMENNIKVVYSGYCNLPVAGKGSRTDSYFVVSDGIGCPLVATPQGHNGRVYGMGGQELILTEERLAKWQMVKKRMTVFLTPKNWAPHEYVVWHTTSEIAIDNFIQEYLDLSDLVKTDLALIPLCFRAVGKSGKSKSGKSYRFFHGSVGIKHGLMQLKEDAQNATELKKFFDIQRLEKQFEANRFFHEIEEEIVAPENIEEKIDQVTGQVTMVNKATGKEVAEQVNYGDLLIGFVNETQAKRIVTLAIEQNQEAEIVKIQSTASALALLNKLQSSANKAKAA